MCGRVIQSSSPLRLAIVEGLDLDSRMGNVRPRYNAAPSQELLVIRENHKTGTCSLDLIRWGLIPHSCTDPSGGRRPINAKAESVSRLRMFRDAYALSTPLELDLPAKTAAKVPTNATPRTMPTGARPSDLSAACATSECSIPTWIAPKLPPPARTNAVFNRLLLPPSESASTILPDTAFRPPPPQ
jgi:SOS response associated peptidase (SRAP)